MTWFCARSAVWCCDGIANLWTIKIELLYMLWNPYKLAMMRCSEFLRQQITGILNFANQNSNYLTFQKLEFQKKIWPWKRNQNSASDGGPRNPNQKLEFPTKPAMGKAWRGKHPWTNTNEPAVIHHFSFVEEDKGRVLSSCILVPT
jgi:hypothetical protein